MALSATSSALGAVAAPAQATQVSKQRERAGNSTAEVRRLADLIEIHVNGIEEGQEDQSPAQLRVNGDELPEEEKPQGQKKEKKKKGQPKPPPPPEEDSAAATDAVTEPASAAPALSPRPLPPRKPAGKPNPPSQLYKHLDVQA